jgi:hypothetical protein
MLCFYTILYWVCSVSDYSSCDCVLTFRYFLQSWSYCSKYIFEITFDKCKVNFLYVHGMKTGEGGGRNTAALILKLDTK